MADSILRLKVESQEYDNKLKRAAEGLQRYADGCRKAGGTLEYLDEGVLEYTRSLGKMETVSNSARGKIGEMTKAFTDLSVEYKQLTDQEKAAPFGKALSESLDQLKVRIQSAKQDIDEINKSLNGESSKVGGGLFGGGKLDGMLQVFGGNLMTKAAGWAASFAMELGDCVTQGIELAKQGEGIRIAFERLNQPGLLDNLNEATHGTVSNLELMKAAIKFDNFKLPLEDLSTYLAFAQQKAKDTGESIDYLVTSIVNGLGRQSVQILDNLGISAGEIRKRMAEGGDMVKVVADIIREEMAKAGDYVETAADRAAQADKRLTDAMEDLGRTFQPLTDAGASMWNSLKVGALDLLNNAVRPLIDALTEAGRIRSQYAKQGGDARVNRQVDRLKNIGSVQNRRATYNAQLSNYDSKIGSYEQYLSDYKKWQSDKTAVGAYDRMQAFQKQTGLSMYSDVKEQLEVFKKMRSEYVMGAKSIIADNPAPSPATPTDNKKTKPTSSTRTTTKPEQAMAKFNQAERDYQQALLQAAMELKAGTITDAEAKKKELQAKESLWKSIGDAREIYDSPKLEEAQRNVENEIIYFGGVVKSSADAQKASEKAARELEAAQKKLTDAETERANALKANDLKSYLAANKKVTAAGGEAAMSLDFTYTPDNLDAFIANLKERISQANIGGELFDSLNAQLADAQSLANVMKTSIENGIDAAQFDPQEIFKKIFGDGQTAGDYIGNEWWQAILNTMTQQSGKKFSLDTRSGAITTAKGGKDGVEQFMGDFSKVTGSISNIASGIQNLGIEIPDGLSKTIGVLQTMSGILTGILTITTLIQATETAKGGFDVLTGLAKVGLMTIGMNHGGIVPRSANGYYVPGKRYSGDTTPILANAGELVLNKSSQGNLAAMIRNAESLVGMIDRYQNSFLGRTQYGNEGVNFSGGAMQNLRLSASISGEEIRLILKNNGRRTGRGEYVTSNFTRG